MNLTNLSAKTGAQLIFFAACAVLFVLLYVGAWALKWMLPQQHPLREKLTSKVVLRGAQVGALALIAAYIAVALYQSS
ncbi:hypothetical protein QTH87_21390 [Variovorax sp. J22P168]|uniref:hypothetical protein n=1 Tax=Variovorax jilinensis TaxID=3053513 RepID=UPI002574ECD0|nr:hypothetical protein [Variovorax sp. J22P168]MDM0015014.1 hypothetical protein [Variovorax sp. J22P168]